MIQILFVYGTLLRGERHHMLLADATFLGPHRTAPRFALYHLGDYPGLMPGHQAVSGELFALDSMLLRRIDAFEDCPRIYTRISLPTPHGRAWAYRYRGLVHDRALIATGDWRTVSRRRISAHRSPS